MASSALIASHSSPSIPTGTDRLSRDMATLVNNRQGSDIQFRVGGDTPKAKFKTGRKTGGNKTIYAHSLILRCRSRYFAAMLDENPKTIINKPNISPNTFEDVLYYIYTGTVRVKDPENIVELIAAADEMDLEELKINCQNILIRTIRSSLTKKEGPPVNIAVSTLIVPALNLANSPSSSHLSQELLTVILSNMSVIIESQDACTAFVSGISSEALIKIISSDDLVLRECSIWDLTLSWACCQIKLSKTAVEARLTNYEDDIDDNMGGLEEKSSHPFVSTTQLKQLKEILAPLLPFIRFSLLKPEDYTRIVDTLSFFLSRRRSSALQRFFISPLSSRPPTPDSPRKKPEKRAREGDLETSSLDKKCKIFSPIPPPLSRPFMRFGSSGGTEGGTELSRKVK